MKYGSVCSGIEAASVAWESLGWQAQWYSEIEHFPSAVLAHRFPTVPNLGDMTQIHNSEHFNGNSIDILVGGTPCQSFSVAGLRKGLDDTRGQLMLTFCELAARKRPKWVVWENVPGVLSSNKGEDLASFLGLLTGREIHPPVGGWKNSGVVEGIGSAYGVAWTVLDAQHFGVAQRRRRIFAVGYLGDWRPAAAVLFESYRLSGDIKEGRKKRKATSADAQGGSGGRGFRMTAFGEYADDNSASTLKQRDYKDATDLAVEAKPIGINGDVAGTLDANYYKGCGSANYGEREVVTHAFKVRGGSETETGEQGGTPGKKAGKGYLGSDELAFTIGTTQDQQIAQPIAYENHPGDSRVKEMGETCQTVSARFGTGGGNVPLVQQPSAGFIPKNGAKASGIGYAEEQSPTLDTNCNNVGLVQPLAVDCYNQTVNEKTSQTIGSSASDVNHYGAVLQPNIKNENYFEPNPFNDTFAYKGINHGRTQERDSVKTLSILREKIGTKAFAQWGLGVFNTLQSTQILQSDLHGIDVRPATFSDSRFIYGSLSCKENDSAWIMQSLREAGCEGCTSQGWKLSEQYIGELRAYLSELPHEKPQNKRFMHDLWEADERFGLLRQALSKVQKIWQPTYGESKPTSHPYAIRRLTAFECEILQGFPRGWTRIPYRNKPAEQCPDGPRYKACGNSMAVPCMFWLGKRIQMVEDVMQGQNRK
jgi:site-specific DNA-cytosine methylase